MEIFGMPVVVTVQDVLSLGVVAIVLGLLVLMIPVCFVLFVIERYIELRNKKCG